MKISELIQTLLLRIEFFPTCCSWTTKKGSFRFGKASNPHNSTNSDIFQFSGKQDKSEWLVMVIFMASVWLHAMQGRLLVMQALVMFLEPSLLVQACQQPLRHVIRFSALACPHVPQIFCKEEVSSGKKVSMRWCPGLCCPKSAQSMRQLIERPSSYYKCMSKEMGNWYFQGSLFEIYCITQLYFE